MAKRKNSSTKKMGCGRWAVYVIGVILALPICGQIGQTLNVLPDGAEQTQTRVAQNATRQQRTAVSSDRQMTSTPPRTPTPTRTRISLQTASVRETAQVRASTAAALPVLYASRNANLRKCAGTTGECAVIGSVAAGYELAIIGQEEGEEVAGSTLWYLVDYDKQSMYIHSSLVTDRKPVVQPPTSRPQNNNSGSAQTAPTNPPAAAPPLVEAISTPMPQSPFGCNGMDDLNCDDFKAIGQNANAHLAACGDEDNLDGDGDGRACER